jgi:hypothetical protein
MKHIEIALALLCMAGVCQAQVGAEAPLRGGPGTDADVRSKHADPAAVEIPLYAGAPLSDVLQALSDKGFLIKWDKKQVLPTMKLLEKPKATRVDSLLSEILTPWGMRADRNQFDGGYRVRPMKKKLKKAEPPAPAAT